MCRRNRSNGYANRRSSGYAVAVHANAARQGFVIKRDFTRSNAGSNPPACSVIAGRELRLIGMNLIHAPANTLHYRHCGRDFFVRDTQPPQHNARRSAAHNGSHCWNFIPPKAATVARPPIAGSASCRPKKLNSDRVIPLAFHVDYWNYIGWIDPYSQARFGERQRQQSRRRGASFVFTPQLLLNGRDYRRAMLFDDIGGKVKTINQTRSQASIRLKLDRHGNQLDSQIDIDVDADAAQRGVEVFLALYENNLATAVTAGENKGLILKHDFVVRELVGPLALDDKRGLSRAHAFTIDPRWKPHDIHIAVFVQQPQSGDVLQALSASCR